MNWSDDELRAALRRRAPDEEFTDRVMARIELEREASFPRRVRALSWRPALRWVAACAACLLIAIGLARYQHQRHMRAEAEIAGQQATFALRVAGVQFRQALQEAQQVAQQALAPPGNSQKRLEKL